MDQREELIRKTELFAGANRRAMDLLLTKGEFVGCDKGCVLSEQSRFQNKLAVVLAGTVHVSKKQDGKRVLLNVIQAGRSFGATTLFGQQHEFVTRVTAKTPVTLLFLSEETLKQVFEADAAVALAYIAFLSDRIRFLNGKIDAFTGTSAAHKLALYLLDEHKKQGEEINLPNNLRQIASLLDIGRATLYRALDELTESGAIRREGRRVFIDDLEQLTTYAQKKEGF